MSPFDSARFAALTGGLEVSVVPLSVAMKDNALGRIDSNYFGKEALENERILDERAASTLRELSDSILSFGAYALTNSVSYLDNGIPFLRCTDIKDGFVVFENALRISQSAHELLRKSEVKPHTVLLTMSGSVGEIAVALPDWDYPVNSNQDIAKIRTSQVDPFYLSAFLRSRYGSIQIIRLPVGSVQQHIFLSMIESLRIVRLDTAAEKAIGGVLSAAYKIRNSAGDKLREAEILLLGALGLRGWSPPEPLTYTRSAADVATAGRLDAQYFQPAKADMLARLATLASKPLSASFDVIRDLVDPRSRPSALCRNYDLTDALQPVLDASKQPVTFADMDSQKVRFRDGDLAVARLRAYLREIAVVKVEDDVPSVGSSEFYVLRRKAGARTLSAEALMIFLRSPPVQIILKWCQDGSQHPRFAERDLMAIPLPDCVFELNEILTAAVAKALSQRALSQRLLDAAKRAVEIAIEDGEAAALAFLAAQIEATDGASG